MTFITVIIPSLNEERYISECLDSVLAQDYPKNKMEVFVVDGDSTDRTAKIVETYIAKFSFIQLIENPKKIVPHAMNLGIKRSTGDYIIRLDAHAYYPPNYFSQLIFAAIKYDTDNVGGLCITEVKNQTPKSTAIKTVLSHKFGVGNSDFRTGVSEPKLVDTVPFGCFKRNVFDRFGFYDERLIRNQDIELNKRINSGGGKILLIPNISCTYYARETKRELSRNNFDNGLWNVLTLYYTKKVSSLSIRHFVPLLFVLSILVPLTSSLIYTPFIYISGLSLLLYFTLVLIVSISICKKNSQNIFYLLPSFFLLHTSYGLGSMIGITKIIKSKFSKSNHDF